MVKLRVQCLTYAHSRARPVPSLPSPGYDLPPIASIPVRSLISIERRAPATPRTLYLATGTCAPTARSPRLRLLSTGAAVVGWSIDSVDRQHELQMTNFLLPQSLPNIFFFCVWVIWSDSYSIPQKLPGLCSIPEVITDKRGSTHTFRKCRQN